MPAQVWQNHDGYNNIQSGAGFSGGYSSDFMTITTFIPEYRIHAPGLF